MDTRDYVIVGVLVALIVWFFCRRRSCGCNTPAPVVGNQGSTVRSVSSGGCGPFACGGRENLGAPLAQPLRRI